MAIPNRYQSSDIFAQYFEEYIDHCLKNYDWRIENYHSSGKFKISRDGILSHQQMSDLRESYIDAGWYHVDVFCNDRTSTIYLSPNP
jgi:hypothetical protein